MAKWQLNALGFVSIGAVTAENDGNCSGRPLDAARPYAPLEFVSPRSRPRARTRPNRGHHRNRKVKSGRQVTCQYSVWSMGRPVASFCVCRQCGPRNACCGFRVEGSFSRRDYYYRNATCPTSDPTQHPTSTTSRHPIHPVSAHASCPSTRHGERPHQIIGGHFSLRIIAKE